MGTNVSEKVRTLLRCPETGQPLREASPEELARFDANLREGGFITEDEARVYPIQDGFPILIAAEAIRQTVA